jgi:lipase chaperone LimK
VYEFAPAIFGVLLMLDTNRQWNNAKRKLEAAGFRVYQNAECEGTALFDADNSDQAKLAIKLARIKQRRKLTPEQRKAAASRLNIARESQNSPVERHLDA